MELSHRHKVVFNKVSGWFWLVFGAASFALGWQNSVALMWAACVYANVKTDFSAAEAADDLEVLERLSRIEALLERLVEA